MKKLLLLLLVLAVTACSTDANEVNCGRGTQVIVDDEDFCVFRQSVVIENGFECPPMMPFFTPGSGFGVCAERGQLPDQLLDRIGMEFPDREEPLPDNNALNNNTNNGQPPGCSSSAECSPGLTCTMGACIAPSQTCTTIADCEDNAYCHFDVSDACGANDAGECRVAPDVCSANFDPVCGCDNQTYNNACVASGAGVSVKALGACN